MKANNAMSVAAALSFQTVFAIVPAIVLAFLVLKAAGVVEDSKKSLHELLTNAGLAQISIRSEEPAGQTQPDTATEPSTQTRPDTATETAAKVVNIAEQIETAISGVEKQMTFARLGPVGLVLLTWTAISLLTMIERVLNRVFEAPRSRALIVRVLLYWSAITFLPVVLLAAGFMATKASQLVSAHAPVAGLAVLLDIATNFVMGVLALACVYKFLPNTRVPFRSAMIGAAVVVPLWILARWGFALYVQFVAKGSVYGALGLLPLFLVWINYSWLAFLFGAELAYTWGNLRRLQLGDESKHILLGPMDMLAAALAVADTYALGRRPARYREIVDRLALPDISVQSLLEKLSEAGIVCLVATPAGEDDAYVPARPLESIRAQDVLTLDLARTQGPQKDEQLSEAMRKVKTMTQDAVGDLTLLQLLHPKP